MNTCHGLKLKIFTICSSNSGSLIRARSLIWRHLQKNKIIIDLIAGFNLLNNNVNTVSLARTYWGIPSSFFEIGVQYGPPACGRRSVLDSNFSEFRRYSPIRPRQTHGITSLLFSKLEAYSVLHATNSWMRCHPYNRKKIYHSLPPMHWSMRGG